MKNFLLFATLLLSANGMSQNKFYVSSDNTGTADGLSWATAFPDVQSFFANYDQGAGNQSDTLMIKEGSYVTNGLLNLQATNKLFIYGGFNGTETYVYQADPSANPTILTADVLGDDDENNSVTFSENHPTVLKFSLFPTANLHIEGVSIRGGNNTGALTGGNGGGICVQAFPGSGTNVPQANSRVRIVNCEFKLNQATNLGGAVYAAPGLNVLSNIAIFDVVIDKCLFLQNGVGVRGAAVMMYCSNDADYGDYDLTVTNSMFLGNFNLGTSAPATIYLGTIAADAEKNLNVLNNTFINNTGYAAYIYSGYSGTNMDTHLNFMNNYSSNFAPNGLGSIGAGDAGVAGNMYEVNARNNFMGAFDELSTGITSNLSNNESTYNAPSDFPNLLSFDINPASTSQAVDYCTDTVGYSQYYIDELDFYGNPRWSGSGIDVGAAEYQQSSTNGLNELVASTLVCFPNPANDFVHVKTAEPVALEIVSAKGASVLTTGTRNQHEIHIVNLPSGVYIIKASNGMVARFVKE